MNLPSITKDQEGSSFFLTDIMDTKSQNTQAPKAVTIGGPSPLAKPRRRELSPNPSTRRFLSPCPSTSNMTYEEKMAHEKKRANFSE